MGELKVSGRYDGQVFDNEVTFAFFFGLTEAGHAEVMDWRSHLKEATVRQKSKTRILIVDPDELSLALIRSSLETQDYLAYYAFDCDKALSIAAKEPLDLVICDSELRTDTGVDVQTLIHRVPMNSNVPFLFTSCSQKPDVISRRCDDRNVFFVRKPFEHEALLELVEFAMWMPNSIRSHIEKMHHQQGLKRPHTVPGPGILLPQVSMSVSGTAQISNP